LPLELLRATYKPILRKTIKECINMLLTIRA
jgi:hypothetical protein